jgi:hypothetical protein
VFASADPFAPQGVIYRRGVDERSPLVPVTGGLPVWLDGIVHTGCTAANGTAGAVADELTSRNGPCSSIELLVFRT